MKILYTPEMFMKKPTTVIKDFVKCRVSSVALDLRSLCLSKDLAFKSKAEKKKKAGEILLAAEPQRLAEAASAHLAFCRKNGMKNELAFAPSLKVEDAADKKYEDASEILEVLTKESINLCAGEDIKILVLEPCIGIIEKLSMYGSLAKEKGITLLIKNSTCYFNGHYVRGEFSEAERLIELTDNLNTELGAEIFGICFDIGEASLCSKNMYDFITALGSRIKAVIASDNIGLFPSRLLPFTAVKTNHSTTDWLNIVRGLRAVAFDGYMIMDFSDSMNAIPFQLRASYINFAKATADYLVWQLSMEQTIRKYQERVLFGAGNMCRAYMKCYGEEFPPLFTCDNNKNLWGSRFEGLEIKNPEELKNIPEDCAIFICNLYYDEISAQLKDMELKNPVERFNDEYMPSFHFDRIDAETRQKN